MRPADKEVRCLAVIRKPLLTVDQVFKSQAEVTRELVPEGVVRFCPNPPAAVGINVTQDGEVDIIVDGKIIASSGPITDEEGLRKIRGTGGI